MKFKTQPETFTAVETELRILPDTSAAGVKIYWAKYDELGNRLEEGNLVLPLEALPVWAQTEASINKGGHIQGEELRGMVNQLLAANNAGQLADFVADPIEEEPTEEPTA